MNRRSYLCCDALAVKMLFFCTLLVHYLLKARVLHLKSQREKHANVKKIDYYLILLPQTTSLSSDFMIKCQQQ